MSRLTCHGPSRVITRAGAIGYDPDTPTGSVPDPTDYADDTGWFFPTTDTGAPGYVQHKRGAAAGGVVTVTLDATPVPGNILVMCVPLRESIGVTPTLSGTGWTLIRSEFTGDEAGNWPAFMWWRVVQSGDGAVWTATNPAAPTNISAWVVELEGVSELDEDAGSGDTTGEATVSITPVTAEPIIILSLVSIRDDGDLVLTPATGMTEIVEDMLTVASAGPNVGINYRVVTSPTGSYTVGSTLSYTGSQRAVIAASFTASGDVIWLPAFAANDGSDTTFDAVFETGITAASLVFLRGSLGLPVVLASLILRVGLEDAGSTTITIEGADDEDFTAPDEIGSASFTATGSYTAQDVTITLDGTVGYPYIRFVLGAGQGVRVYEVELFAAPDASVAIDDHLADTTDAHDASAVSLLDAAGNTSATNVEDAIAELYGLTDIWRPVMAYDGTNWYVVVDGDGTAVMAQG